MTTLKPYQDIAAGNICEIFRYVAGQLKQVEKTVERQAIVSHNGGVLLKSPTGSGKTFIAGEIVSRLSREENVVWFWFAPFKGLVGQTEASLREDYPTLRVRNLKADRQPEGTRSGDIWVSTWQSVAARDTDARKIRSTSEENLSLDALLHRLRAMGYFIGVVVDESHHGFGHGTQALEYYTQHLCPEFTLLLTATPDDADADAFKRAAGFKRLHPVTISRKDAVAAGLVKPAVRSIAFVAELDQKSLVDFESIALSEGARTHWAVKAGLKDAGDGHREITGIAELVDQFLHQRGGLAGHAGSLRDGQYTFKDYRRGATVRLHILRKAVMYCCVRAFAGQCRDLHGRVNCNR